MKPAKIALTLVLVAFVLACDSPTALEPHFSMNAAAVPDGMVPIQIREAVFNLAPGDAIPVMCDPGAAGVFLPNYHMATGVASHLGRVSTVVVISGCTLDLATGVVSMNGTTGRTAANGDVLLGTWTGTLAGSALTLDVTFTGGSGRFQNAAGWAGGGGQVDVANGTGEWTLTGRINPPGR